jgi:hypothetical protein
VNRLLDAVQWRLTGASAAGGTVALLVRLAPGIWLIVITVENRG